ncbi:hypothetical protein GTQ40_04595 [Flavobacteriaceae bacterium R38]|nr:hypothetical protein [Flavobacteriaceae bacterium R38]
MKNDNLEELFNQLEGKFDIDTPEEGHQERFLQKLNAQQDVVTLTNPKRKKQWRILSIAATLLLLVSVGIGINKNNNDPETVISPEIQETQIYFTSLLNEEVEKLNAASDEDTKTIIDDAMIQLKRLEADYNKLEENLLENGSSKQILYAMITNFQVRIDLLEDILSRIEEIKQQKNSNESNII